MFERSQVPQSTTAFESSAPSAARRAELWRRRHCLGASSDICSYSTLQWAATPRLKLSAIAERSRIEMAPSPSMSPSQRGSVALALMELLYHPATVDKSRMLT